MVDHILAAFGLQPQNYHVESFGSGLINYTYKVAGEGRQYILQRINTNVFTFPGYIDENLSFIGKYLQKSVPDYLFVAPMQSPAGKSLLKSGADYYRLYPFIEKSHTVDFISNAGQAFEAAAQFGKFSRLLNGVDATALKYTLPDFHNLNLRVEQFNKAVASADPARLSEAHNAISAIAAQMDIADVYAALVEKSTIPLRVIHHDTKINNVLLDENDKGICVIDLDTVMPGYYISDVGDMMRTYLSEANEEEQDLDKISIRKDVFTQIHAGYMSQMHDVLTDAERNLFIYSGKFMIYMQAIRFLTDFLNGDIYYHTTYPKHNLVRARNQLVLLEKYNASEDKFKQIIREAELQTARNTN